MKKIACWLTTVFLSLSVAHADTPLQGFYVGLDASYETMTVKTPTASENFGTGNSLILHAGYEYPLNEKYAVLLGGTYDLDYYLQGGSGSKGTVFSRNSETLHQKTKWGIYAAPGLYLHEQHFVFAKLIYSTMKTDPEGVRTGTPNFTSVGYGLGYRYTLLQDQFITLEWASLPTNKVSFTSFKSGADIAPNLSMISLGWAKRF